MTPSNTDTELRQLITELISPPVLAILEIDWPIDEFNKAVADVAALIARRDTEKREALLKAVGESGFEVSTKEYGNIEVVELENVQTAIQTIYGGEK